MDAKPYPKVWISMTISNGNTLAEGIAGAIRVAKTLDVGVKLTYNDSTVYVKPHSTEEEELRRFYGEPAAAGAVDGG